MSTGLEQITSCTVLLSRFGHKSGAILVLEGVRNFVTRWSLFSSPTAGARSRHEMSNSLGDLSGIKFIHCYHRTRVLRHLGGILLEQKKPRGKVPDRATCRTASCARTKLITFRVGTVDLLSLGEVPAKREQETREYILVVEIGAGRQGQVGLDPLNRAS